MKVKIKNCTYKIIEVDSFKDAPANIEFACGHTDYVNQVIRINKKLGYEQKRQTLIHELTHSFFWVYGFGQITEQIPIEIMCDFIGCYADDIVKIANKYFKEREE